MCVSSILADWASSTTTPRPAGHRQGRHGARLHGRRAGGHWACRIGHLPARALRPLTPTQRHANDGGPATDPTPILGALSLLPPDIGAFEFTDWAALKAAHGGSDVTSASPLAERQWLLLDITREEYTTVPPGLDRLDTWSERWGWDTTDLEWQASAWRARTSPSSASTRTGVQGRSWRDSRRTATSDATCHTRPRSP